MLVLASASVRRQELLKNAGVEFVARPANIPEIPLDREAPDDFARRMAREKARRVWDEDQKGYVLGADTVVVVDDFLLGKPKDENDAARMLRLLSGRKHQVTTGVCLIGNGFEDVRSQSTSVEFSPLHDREIRAYIQSGEPLDKAGAYAIQGQASLWVKKIEGDYSNVVGLPLTLVLEVLREHGAIST
ncbi:MAG: septum formation inhibitor Maf [Acidobacteria bacterium]|nr:septum formation inhibitor Maf [Acidobacteriota bacterium]